MPKSRKLKMGVKMSSKAEAKDFMIELRFLRKSDVTIPTRLLFRMMARAYTWKQNLKLVKKNHFMNRLPT